MSKLPLVVVSKVVINAIRALKQSNGCRLATIKKYIDATYSPEEAEKINKKLPIAIKRGINFGAIKKNNGHYKLDSIMAISARKARKARRSKKGKRGKSRRRRRRRRRI